MNFTFQIFFRGSYHKHVSLVILFACLNFSYSFGQKLDSLLVKKNDFALIFAVDDYDHENDLNNPIENAKRIAFLLEEDYGFQVDTVFNPTLEMIEDKILTYTQYYAENEDSVYHKNGQLLIYFSGHGAIEDETGYFFAKDSDPKKIFRTAFPYSIWRSKINNIQCNHIMVMIDACYSGSFDELYDTRSTTDPEWRRKGEPSEGDKLFILHNSKVSRHYLTSGALVKTPDRSNFARKLIGSLESKGGEDGILTSKELYADMEFVEPTPKPGYFGDDEDGSSFIFVSEVGRPVFHWTGIEVSLVSRNSANFIYHIDHPVLRIISLDQKYLETDVELLTEDVIVEFMQPAVELPVNELSLKNWEGKISIGQQGIIRILRKQAGKDVYLDINLTRTE